MTELGPKPITPRAVFLGEPASRPAGPTLDIGLILRRQRLPLTFCALLGLIAGALHYATSPERHYASAIVLIDERATDPGQEFASEFPLLRSETAVLNEMQVLTSLELAKQVVRDLRLHEDPAFADPPVSAARHALGVLSATLASLLPAEPVTETSAGAPAHPDQEVIATAAALKREVSVNRVGRSFSVEIGVLLHDPELAAQIANGYAAAYLADRQQANRDASEESASWLRANIEEVRRSANAAAIEAAAFRAENRASDPQGLRELEQRVITLNDLHARLLERLEMITIEGSFPMTNGRLLSEALTPRDPALPSAWRLLSVGLVLGLTAGLAIAVLRELRETGLRTGVDVRRQTGLPFLGYLPRLRRARLKRALPVVTRRQGEESVPMLSFIRGPGGAGRHRTAASDSPGPREGRAPAHFDPMLYLPSVEPELAYNHTLQAILARLDRIASRQACIVAVASIDGGAGRTTLAANLAQLAALGGGRTLLIDADFRNPALSRRLGLEATVGLGEVLAGKVSLVDAATALPATGLDVLPYRSPRDPSGEAGIFRLPGILELARAHYGLVVVDTQPLAASADVAAMLPALDAAVLVADWGRTTPAALAEATANEPELARKTAGVVLNRTRTTRLKNYGVHVDPSANGRRRSVT